jgi:hypothetical protein
MDPASAIGVASACISFIQFTIMFVQATKAIHNSASDAPIGLSGLQTREAVIAKIEELATRASFQKVKLDDQEAAVNHVAHKCKAISKEVVDLLKTIEPKVGKNGQYSWYESLKAATKGMIKKSKLDMLQDTLKACIEELLQQRIFSDTYVNDPCRA